MAIERPFGNATVSDSPFGRASPILVLGIMVFILPMIGTIFNWNIPFKGFISGFGIFLILVGAIHSALKG